MQRQEQRQENTEQELIQQRLNSELQNAVQFRDIKLAKSLIKKGAQVGTEVLKLIDARDTELYKFLMKQKVNLFFTGILGLYSESLYPLLSLAVMQYNNNYNDDNENEKIGETINFLLRCGFALCETLRPSIRWQIPVVANTVAIKFSLCEDVGLGEVSVTKETPHFAKAITEFGELDEAVSQLQPLNIETPVFLSLCESLINQREKFLKSHESDYDSIDPSNPKSSDLIAIIAGPEIDELTDIRDTVKANLSLKELCITAVCKHGIFSQCKEDEKKRQMYKDSIPAELRKEIKQYRRYRV